MDKLIEKMSCMNVSSRSQANKLKSKLFFDETMCLHCNEVFQADEKKNNLKKHLRTNPDHVVSAADLKKQRAEHAGNEDLMREINAKLAFLERLH